MDGLPITWSSQTQPIVAISSTEVEYGALDEATKELVWLQALLQDLQVEKNQSMMILCDNFSNVKLHALCHACEDQTQRSAPPLR